MSKAENVKARLKEAIEAKTELYNFLDANPKGKGNEAHDYLVKRGISSKTAIETIKEYGKEHHDGTDHPHPHKEESKEEVTGPAPNTTMVQKNEDEKPIIDEGNSETYSSNVGDIRGQAQTLNTYKESLNTKEHMSEDKIEQKPEDIIASKENDEEEAPQVEAPAEDSDEVGVPNSENGVGKCPDGQDFDSTTRKCVPANKSAGKRDDLHGVIKSASSRSDSNESGNKNADIHSEKKRVAEYYKKLDRLEALRNLKVADARIAAKEKFLKEKRLDKLIRSAKENVKPRASVVPRASVKAGEAGVRPKVSAQEAEVHAPVKWMRDVATEKNVSPSFVWHVNKQNIFEGSNSRFLKEFDAADNTKYNPIPSTIRGKAGEALAGPAANDFMRTMSEQVLVLPDGKVVTPIRQFCETKVLEPGNKEAFFYDFGPVTFADVTEGSVIGDSTTNIRSAGGAATPRGTKLTIGYTQLEESPIDIVAAANRSYALESVNDESVEVLQRAFNDDVGSAGDATNRKDKGGGAKTNRWVDESGVQITADGSGMTNLTFAGLVAAKGVIEDEGLDPSNLVTYTTGKAIRDLIFDPDLDSFISFSRPAIITEATVERIAGTNVVRSSAPASGTQSGSKRSVMFVPNIAFGLVTGRDLTMEAQRRNEIQSIYLTGTQRIAGFVKNVEATCRISHT